MIRHQAKCITFTMTGQIFTHLINKEKIISIRIKDLLSIYAAVVYMVNVAWQDGIESLWHIKIL
jgi:hypothetical protein